MTTRPTTSPLIRLAMAASLLLAPAAVAQVAITGPQDLTLPPGAETTVTYQVVNDLPTPVEAVLLLQDVLQLSDGAITYLPPGRLQTSIHQLLAFETTSVRVPANDRVDVTATLRAPENATGGYWGVIGVDAIDPQRPGHLGARALFSIVTKLDIEGASTRAVHLRDLAYEHTGQRALVTFTLVNAGDTYERARLTIELHGPGGVAGQVTRTLPVHPNKVVPARIPLPDPLPAGEYQARVTLEADGLEPHEHTLTITHR